MDINKMLEDLRRQRDQVTEIIVVLERLLYRQGKRRGRPAKWMNDVNKTGDSKTSKIQPERE